MFVVVFVGVLVGVFVLVLVFVGVFVFVGVLVVVLVGVFVTVLVGVLVFVGVIVNVLVGVLVEVIVGVIVGVLVDVLVGVIVGVFVDVFVGVFVDVTVFVGVLVGVFVDVFVGVDVIVGFPGETEEHFLETYQFLNELEISYLHVFTYSERDNTPAKDMAGSVPVAERKRRNKMLRILSAKKLRAFYEKQQGKSATVLVEHEEKYGFLHGFTENYVKVKIPYASGLANTTQRVILGGVDEEGMVACDITDNVIA